TPESDIECDIWNVRQGPKADIRNAIGHVRFTPESVFCGAMSTSDPKRKSPAATIQRDKSVRSPSAGSRIGNIKRASFASGGGGLCLRWIYRVPSPLTSPEPASLSLGRARAYPRHLSVVVTFLRIAHSPRLPGTDGGYRPQPQRCY